jgi:hypothetical protein
MRENFAEHFNEQNLPSNIALGITKRAPEPYGAEAASMVALSRDSGRYDAAFSAAPSFDNSR